MLLLLFKSGFRNGLAVFLALFMSTSICFATGAWAEEVEMAPALEVQGVVNDERSQEPDRSQLSEEQQQQLAVSMRAALEAEEQEYYDQALKHFVDAYAILPHSNILLATARVSQKAGDSQTALTGYRQFLERRPDYEDREQLEEIIAALDEELEEEDRADDQGLLADLELPNPSIIGWSGLGVTALGLVAMIAGGGTAISVTNDFDTLEQHRLDRDRQAYDDLAADIGSKQTRGKVFLYGGMGLAMLGVTAAVVDYLVLDHPPLLPLATGSSHSQMIVGTTGDGGFSLGWIQRF